MQPNIPLLGLTPVLLLPPIAATLTPLLLLLLLLLLRNCTLTSPCCL
jgi:hypothetical protein